MRSRLPASLALGLAACASATMPGSGGDDAPAGVDGSTDGCADQDGDGVCDLTDTCPGFDDRVDSDTDTIADGCDVCAGEDDRNDVNANMVPDCTELVARTIDLKVVGSNLWRGWHASGTQHESINDNTLTGVSLNGTYNTYFVFPLTGFTASTILSIELELELEAYSSNQATEAVSVWDVSTPAATVEASGMNPAVFSDLQSGAMYATSSATAAQLTNMLSIPLSAQAATDATARLGGDFVVGVHLEAPGGYIRFGNTGPMAPPTVNRIKIEYLP